MSADRPRETGADRTPPAGTATSPHEKGLLVARGVSKAFAGFYAVRDVSLTLEQGPIVGLIGPNGAGKTTLFNLLSRFLAPTEGQIWFNGERVDRLPPHLLARRGMVRTFQISRVLAKMTVRENLMLAAPNQAGESLWRVLTSPRAVWAQEREQWERAEELLEYFDLIALRDEYAGALSGGQRKLLEMARALMTNPSLLLLDEPLAGVNPALSERIIEYIVELNRRGLTLLVVEHDIDAIMTISDRLLVMADGRIIARGTPRNMRNNADVIEAYLGTAAAQTAGAGS